VAALCARLGVPHRVLLWEGPKPANGLQAAARAARYDLLAQEARRLGHAAIVTAHTLDDQAETLLMRMAHGSGPAGLAGMPFRRRRGDIEIFRPLLDVAKMRLIDTARARGLPYVDDPSNADPRFERVRWRTTTALLAEHGLNAARLGLLARRMARQEAALAAVAAAALERVRMAPPVEGVSRLGLRPLAAEPDEILLRILTLALGEMAGIAAESYGRLERLEACAGALIAALRASIAMRRTLSGFILSLDAKGVLTIRPEGARRRGIHPATS
jgi:tRNA(Ile)-lysidine synthase